MNIGVDIRTLSFRRGGISQYTYYLLKNLIRLDNKNQYYLFNFTKSSYEWDTFRGNVREIVLRFPQRIGLKCFWENLLVPFAAWKYDINIWFSPDFFVPKSLRIPCLVTIHDLIFMRYYDPSSRYSLQMQAKVAYAIKHAARIIVTSHFTSEDISKVFPYEKENVSVIHLAADERFYPIKDRFLLTSVLSRYGIDFPYILFVGETSHRKNIVGLLRAFRILKDKGRLCGQKLLIVGKRTSNTDEILQEISEIKLSEEVFFTGYIPDEDLPFIYNGADVFVFPSLYEGFGIPILEAMSCQVPVVASNVTSIPEVAGNGALLCDPYDIDDIADKIDQIVNKRIDIDELNKEAMSQVSKFSWVKTARETIDILELAGCFLGKQKESRS